MLAVEEHEIIPKPHVNVDKIKIVGNSELTFPIVKISYNVCRKATVFIRVINLGNAVECHSDVFIVTDSYRIPYKQYFFIIKSPSSVKISLYIILHAACVCQ